MLKFIIGFLFFIVYLLKHSIGLGYIIRGNQRYGEKVHAVNPLRKEIIEVEIHSPHFYDPEGELLRG